MGNRPLEQTIPGNLLAIHQVGVLLLGQSGSGKSDISLELLHRGHALIADDSVNLQRVDQHIEGSCPTVGQGMLFIHEIGLIDITKVFGEKAFQEKCPIEMVIQLRASPSNSVFDQVAEMALLNLTLPCYFLSQNSFRPISTLIETLVKCFQLEKQGFDALKHFRYRQRHQMDENRS